ncbi:hypothetical protein [Methylobacterium frigidaeris]|nr:hypothetical protein [Methylobacterium frigidaeris]
MRCTLGRKLDIVVARPILVVAFAISLPANDQGRVGAVEAA